MTAAERAPLSRDADTAGAAKSSTHRNVIPRGRAAVRPDNFAGCLVAASRRRPALPAGRYTNRAAFEMLVATSGGAARRSARADHLGSSAIQTGMQQACTFRAPCGHSSPTAARGRRGRNELPGRLRTMAGIAGRGRGKVVAQGRRGGVGGIGQRDVASAHASIRSRLKVEGVRLVAMRLIVSVVSIDRPARHQLKAMKCEVPGASSRRGKRLTRRSFD
jgi:hypothetical protein